MPKIVHNPGNVADLARGYTESMRGSIQNASGLGFLY